MSSSPSKESPKKVSAADLMAKARARVKDRDKPVTSSPDPQSSPLATQGHAVQPPAEGKEENSKNDPLSRDTADTPRADGDQFEPLSPLPKDPVLVSSISPEHQPLASRGKSLLHSALAKKKSLSRHDLKNPVEGGDATSKPLLDSDVTSRDSSSPPKRSGSKHASESLSRPALQDLLELETSTVSETDHSDSTVLFPSQTAPAKPKETPQGKKKEIFYRVGLFKNDRSESCVHVSMTDYSNALLELPPLIARNPCSLLSLHPLLITTAGRELFRDAQMDVESTLKSLQALLKTGIVDNFLLLFSRASKLCANAKSDGAVQVMFTDAGICNLLVSLISSRATELPVLSCALNFIHALCTEQRSDGLFVLPQAIQAFVNAGLIKVLLDVMVKFMVHETLCEHAMDVFSLLLLNSGARATVGAAGGCQVCCGILNENMTSYSLVRKTCVAIMCLAQERANADILLQEKALDLLLRVTSSCSDADDKTGIWSAAIAATSELACIVSTGSLDKLLHSHFCGVYLDLLNKFKLENPGSLESLNLLLFSFCKLYTVPELKERFRHENMFGFFHSFILKHIDDDLIVSMACTALAFFFHYSRIGDIALMDGFSSFFSKLLRKYRGKKVQFYIYGCVYQMLLKDPQMPTAFHCDKIIPELMSSLVNAVDLERGLNRWDSSRETAIETTAFTTILCGVFYVMAVSSAAIRYEMVEKVNACSCFVALLSLLQGRASADAVALASKSATELSNLDESAWFDQNNDVLFSSCLSCIAVMYLPKVYSAEAFYDKTYEMTDPSNPPRFELVDGTDDFYTSSQLLLSESNFVSLMTILPQFWTGHYGEDSLIDHSVLGLQLRQRRIEMLCWAMYHLSVACPKNRMYTIREKCVGLIRYANKLIVNESALVDSMWRCVVPLVYLLLSCCTDAELTKELIDYQIFAFFPGIYYSNIKNADSLCAITYVVSELLTRYEVFRSLFLEVFDSSQFLKHMIKSVDIHPNEAVLLYNVFTLIFKVISLDDKFLAVILTQLNEVNADLAESVVRSLKTFENNNEVIISIFRLVYSLFPDMSVLFGRSGVCQTICTFVARGLNDRRLSITACMAMSALCLTTSSTVGKLQSMQDTELGPCEDNQRRIFDGYACGFISSLLCDHKSDNRVLEAAAIAIIHLTDPVKRFSLKAIDPSEIALSASSICSAKFVDLGCVDSLLDILNKIDADSELLVHICGALQALSLASVEVTLNRLDHLNSAEIFVSLLNTYGGNIPVMISICETTKCLAKVASHSHALQSLGIRQTLNVGAVLNNHDPVALTAIIGLLVELMSSDPNRSRLDENDCSIFVTALKTHPYCPNLVALAGLGVRCTALVAHRETSLAEALKDLHACDVVVDCLGICLKMAKKDSAPSAENLDRLFLKSSSASVDEEEQQQIINAAFQPTEKLADAVSGLCAACAELASGEMYENRLRFQAKSIVSLMSHLIKAFAWFKRPPRVPIGGLVHSVENIHLLRISCRCSEMLCFAIGKLSLLESMRDAFIVAGACEDILDILVRHLDSDDITFTSLCALRQLVMSQQGNVGAIRLISQKACIGLYNCLKRHISNARNVIATLWLIKLLALVASGREDFADVNVIELVMKAMEVHSGNVLVVVQALWALRNLGLYDSKKNLELLCQDECYFSIFSAMKNFPEDMDVAEAGCAAVQLICRYSLDARKSFIKRGMCSILASCCNGLCPNATSVVHCVQAIRELCSCVDVLSSTIKELSEGAIHSSLTRLMYNYVDAQEVLDQVLCLELLLLRHDESAHMKAFSEVSNFCTYLCTLLLRHVEAENVALSACEIIRIFSLSGKTSLKMAEAGAPAAMISALQQHENSHDICHTVCRAISSFCSGNPENTINLSLRGVCEVTVQMLVKHEEREELLHDVMSAILTVSDENNVCKRRYFDYGIGSSILKILRHHKNKKSIIDLGSRLIISLTSNSEDYVIPATELRNIGLTFALDEIILQHIHDVEICIICSTAIAALLVEETEDTKVDPTIHAKLVPNSLSLKNALNSHVTNPDIAKICCEGIARLASRSSILLDLGTSSVCEAVMRAWKIHIDVDDVVWAACVAVQRLACVDSNRLRFANHDFYGIAMQSIISRNQFENNLVLFSDILLSIDETTKGLQENVEIFLGVGLFEIIAKNIGSQKNVSVLRAISMIISTVIGLKQDLAMLFGASGTCSFVARIIHHLSSLKEDPEIILLATSTLEAARALCGYKDNLLLFRTANLFGALDSVLSGFLTHLIIGFFACRVVRQFLDRSAPDFVSTQTQLSSLKMCQKIIVYALDKSEPDFIHLAEIFATLSELCFQHEINISQLLSMNAASHVVSLVYNKSGEDQAVESDDTEVSLKLNSRCCELLGVLCFTPEAQNDIRDAKGCQLIAATLKLSVKKKQSEFTTMILSAFIAIVRNNVENSQLFAKLDVFATFVLSLESWMDCVINAEISLVAFNLLCNCRSYDDITNMDARLQNELYDLDVVASLRLAGAFEAIFDSISRHMEHPKVLEQACWAINNLAADKQCIGRLGSSGGCDALISVLSRYGSSKLHLLQAACVAISTLCDSAANSLSLGVDVVFNSIFSYLKTLHEAYEDRIAVLDETQVKFYDEELDVLVAVNLAITALCKENLMARSALAECGACGVLPKLLKVVHNPNAARSICGAILSMLNEIPENVILFSEGGLLQDILDIFLRIVNAHSLYDDQLTPSYIVDICKTLRCYLTGNPVHCEKAGRLGACHTTVELITRYRGNKFIMAEVSGIVRLLGTISEENLLVFTETGIWNIALDILNKYEAGRYFTSNDSLINEDNQLIQKPEENHQKASVSISLERPQSISFIPNSQSADESRTLKSSTWAANACSALVGALRNQMSSVTATHQNCAAIAKLAANDPENARKLVELGLAESLSGLLRKHVGVTVSILIEVLNTIHAICFRTPENVLVMLQLGLCEATCITFRRHHNDAGIPLAACKAISAMSINEELSTTLGVAGACQSVCRTLQESIASNDAELVEISCRAMNRLIKDNQANQEQFTVGGACELVAGALGTYMTDISDVLEALLWSVAALCRYGASIDTEDQKNCTTLLRLHVDSSLVYILSCFGNAPEIMDGVCTAICNLCYNEASAEGFGNLGTCKVLTDLMKSHLSARNFPILISTVSALANISMVISNVQLLMEYGALEIITNVVKSQGLSTHPSPLLVDRCCVCLQNFCSFEMKASVLLGTFGICKPLYQVLEFFNNKSEDEISCPSLMVNLYYFSWALMSENLSNSSEFSDLGVHKLYLDRLRDSESNVNLMLPILGACRAVSAVAASVSYFAEEGACPRLVSLLRRYIKRADLIENICGTMSNMVKTDPAYCILFDEAEACDALIACMRRHLDSPEVAVIICDSISDLGVHAVTCKQLGKSGACESVVETLQRFSGNVTVALHACRAISVLALDSDNIEVLCDLHAYEWVVSALFLAVENEKLVAFACISLSLLHKFYVKNDNRLAGVDFRKLCEISANVLSLHRTNAFAVESISGFVKYLSDDPLSREMLGTFGAPLMLSKCLTVYLENGAVSNRILKAIAAVSLKNDENKSAFSEANVGIAVLDVIRNHWKDLDLLENALFCITTLSFGNVVNTSTFGMNGACELVLKAMAELAPENARIAAVGCQAIFCLSKGEGNLDRFDICGGVDIVADILELYMSNEKVVRHACSALAALGQSEAEVTDDEVKITMAECSQRVCDLIALAFASHLSNKTVLRAVVAAIGTLAESASNSKHFCDAGVCAYLLTALADNRDVVQTSAHILDTMERLAQHFECSAVSEFGNEKCFGSIVSIFELYSEDTVIHFNGCKLLTHVLQLPQDNIAAVLLEPIVRILPKFIMEGKLLLYAFSCIELICRNCAANADKCGSIGGARHLCDALEDSLRHHSSNHILLCSIFKTILALCLSNQNVVFFSSGVNMKTFLHSLTVYINDASIVSSICAVITALAQTNPAFKIEFTAIDSMKILLKSLSKHKTDPNVSLSICTAIFALCDGNRDSCIKLIDQDGGVILLELTKIHRNSSDLCGMAFSILADVIMLQRPMLDILIKKKVRAYIFDFLIDHPLDVAFVLGVMRLLRVYYQIETQERKNLLEPLHCECRVFVEALNNHARNLSICYEICGAVSFLALNERCAVELSEMGACLAIRSRLSDAAAAVNTRLIQSALLCIMVMCKSANSVRDSFCDAGICKVIINVINVPEDKGAIERLVMNCISAIGGGDDNCIPDKRRMDLLIEADACEAICSVLEKRLAEANLVGAPCGAIACLSRYEPARSSLIRLGGGRYLIDVLREHLIVKSAVTEYACRALCNICSSKDGRTCVLDVPDSCRIIYRVLEESINSPLIAGAVCKLVNTLVSGYSDTGLVFFSYGACQSLIKILAKTSDDASAMIECINAIFSLSDKSNVIIECFINAGTTERIIDLALKFVDNLFLSISALEAVVLFGSSVTHATSSQRTASALTLLGPQVADWCMALCFAHLSSSRICYLLAKMFVIFSKGNIPLREDFCVVCIRIILDNMDEDIICEAATDAIIHMSDSGPQYRRWLLDAGAAAASINILSKEMTSPHVANQICNVVQFMAGDDSTNALIAEAGACESISNILESYISDGIVVENACRAIVKLVEPDTENGKRLEAFGVCKLLMAGFRRYLTVSGLSVCSELCGAIELMATDNSENLAKFSMDTILMNLLVQFISKRFVDNGNCSSACRAIAVLAVDANNSELFGRAGVSDTLITILSKNRHNMNYSYDILSAIYALCSTSTENVESFSSKKFFETLLTILSENVTQEVIDDHLTSICLKILCYIGTIGTVRLALGQNGACRLLLRFVDAVVPKGPISTEIFEYTLLSISALCNSPENQRLFGELGAGQTMCEILKRHVEDVSILSATLTAISTLCIENAANVNILCTANVIDLLIATLNTHSRNPLINELVCRVIISISASSNSGSSYVATALVKSPICALITSGLNQHLRARNVNKIICSCMQSLCSLSPLLKIQLDADGACVELVRATEFALKVSDDPLLIEVLNACCGLISDSCSNQEALGAAGLCEFLAEMCNSKSANDAVLEKALLCIAGLCRCGVDLNTASLKNLSRFATTDVCDYVVDILKTNISSLGVIRNAFIVIRDLSANEQNLTQMIGIGGCDALCGTLKRLLHNEFVCEAACGALATFTKTDSYRKLVSLGAVDLITLSLQRYADNKEVIYYSAICVVNLCRDHENKRQFAMKGVCGVLSRILTRHGADTNIAEEVCSAIYHLSASCPENKVLLGAAGACEAIVATLKAHARNLVIGRAGTVALNSLMEGNAANTKRISDAGGERLKVSTLSTVEWRTAPGEQAARE